MTHTILKDEIKDLQYNMPYTFKDLKKWAVQNTKFTADEIQSFYDTCRNDLSADYLMGRYSSEEDKMQQLDWTVSSMLNLAFFDDKNLEPSRVYNVWLWLFHLYTLAGDLDPSQFANYMMLYHDGLNIRDPKDVNEVIPYLVERPDQTLAWANHDSFNKKFFDHLQEVKDRK